MGEPSAWCHCMTLVTKGGVTPKVVIDLSSTLSEKKKNITEHMKICYKCLNSYPSLVICSENCHLITFTIPWGRLRYTLAPKRVLASGHKYNKIFYKTVVAISSKMKCID